jgi:hypothetical protein
MCEIFSSNGKHETMRRKVEGKSEEIKLQKVAESDIDGKTSDK